MTNLHLPETLLAPAPRRPSVAVRAGGLALALTLAARVMPVLAQAPASPPPPPRPAVQAPRQLPPPATATPARGAGPAIRPAPAPVAARSAPLAAPARLGLPVDSVRPRAAAAVAAPPADAVALCKDGTYLVAPAVPSACASHRGLQVAMSRRDAPPAPTAALAAPAAVRAAVPATGPPPAGATMGCKDGTFLSGTPSAAACAGHRGLAVVLPAARTAPPAPRGVTSPQRPAPKGTVQPAAPAPARPTAPRPAAAGTRAPVRKPAPATPPRP